MKAPALIRKRRRTREGRLARELQRERAAREVAEARAANLEALAAQPLRVDDPGVLGAVAYLATRAPVGDGPQARLCFSVVDEFRGWRDLDESERRVYTRIAEAVVEHLRRYGRAEG